MSQRRDTTKWFCYIIALSAGPLWNPVKSVTVKVPPSNPTTVQAQAKFFQDFFSVQLSPYKIEFGHVCEDPHTWEQRYEKKDFKNHRDMGKVRWGDKKGGYGEHYWDLNHAGNVGNHGDDGYDNSNDGAYNVRDHPSDSYDDHNDHSSYGNDDYDPEKSSGSYEENGRSKRAYSKSKPERKPQKVQYDDDDDEDEEEEHHRQYRKQTRKHSESNAAPSHKIEEASDEEDADIEVYKKAPKKHQQQRQQEVQQPKEPKNQVVLVVKEKDDSPDQTQYNQSQQPDPPKYVNYENGAGVRQHQQPEVAASAPRLFLDHTTGRVVDRATGQAYILQPILNNNY